MNNQDIDKTLSAILRETELPSEAKQKAKKRFQALGKWLNRDESKLAQYKPFLYNQGSLRLGTTVRPISNEDDFDLDISCKFQKGANRGNVTQEQLRKVLHDELRAFADSRNIGHNITEKHRCCRIQYSDNEAFHIDVVPCIPARELDLDEIFEGYLDGFSSASAKDVKRHEIYITDDRRPSYKVISNDWLLSNTEGYALWFEEQAARIKDTATVKAARIGQYAEARRSVLQKAVRLLKRHRDARISKEELRPISMIVTTLAAQAYGDELDLSQAIVTILEHMEEHVRQSRPHVPNPVNPKEDFAEKWDADPKLKLVFEQWLVQARKDFQVLFECDSQEELANLLKEAFGLRDYSKISKDIMPTAAEKRRYEIPNIPIMPKAQPWLER